MKQNRKSVRPAKNGNHSINSHHSKQSSRGSIVNASIVRGLISGSGCTKHGGLIRSTERLAQNGIAQIVKKCGHTHGKWEGRDVKSCSQFMGINVLAVEKHNTNSWQLTTRTTTVHSTGKPHTEAAVETLITT